MVIRTTNGVEVETESPEYQAFLREMREEDKQIIPEPAPYRTLGDALELERRRRERETGDNKALSPLRETTPV